MGAEKLRRKMGADKWGGKIALKNGGRKYFLDGYQRPMDIYNGNASRVVMMVYHQEFSTRKA